MSPSLFPAGPELSTMHLEGIYRGSESSKKSDRVSRGREAWLRARSLGRLVSSTLSFPLPFPSLLQLALLLDPARRRSYQTQSNHSFHFCSHRSSASSPSSNFPPILANDLALSLLPRPESTLPFNQALREHSLHPLRQLLKRQQRMTLGPFVRRRSFAISIWGKERSRRRGTPIGS